MEPAQRASQLKQIAIEMWVHHRGELPPQWLLDALDRPLPPDEEAQMDADEALANEHCRAAGVALARQIDEAFLKTLA